jgi:hypothetical protein
MRGASQTVCHEKAEARERQRTPFQCNRNGRIDFPLINKWGEWAAATARQRAAIPTARGDRTRWHDSNSKIIGAPGRAVPTTPSRTLLLQPSESIGAPCSAWLVDVYRR